HKNDYQPRNPQWRLKKRDVNELIIINWSSDSAPNGSGLLFKKSKEAAPNAVHRRPQTDQMSDTCQKKLVDDLAERARHKEQGQHRAARHYSPPEKGGNGKRDQRKQHDPGHESK